MFCFEISQSTCVSFLFNFRIALLLRPPGSGKTTLLKALAGKLEDDLRVCLPYQFFYAILLARMDSHFLYLCMLMIEVGMNRFQGKSPSVDMNFLNLFLKEPVLISASMIFTMVK